MKKKTINRGGEPKLTTKEFEALTETPIPPDKPLLGKLQLWIVLRFVYGLSAARLKAILVGDLKAVIIRLSKSGKDILDIKKIRKRMIDPFFDFTDLSQRAFEVIDNKVLRYQLRGFAKFCGLNRVVTIDEPLAHMTIKAEYSLWEVISLKMITEYQNITKNTLK